MTQASPAPKESHVRWFGRSEDDPNRLLIIEDDHCRVFLDAERRAELYSVIDASRPHPAPAQCITTCKCTYHWENCEKCREHDAAIARQEREEERKLVLGELYDLTEDMITDANRMMEENPKGELPENHQCQQCRTYRYGKGKFIASSVIQMRIESLRHTEREHPR